MIAIGHHAGQCVSCWKGRSGHTLPDLWCLGEPLLPALKPMHIIANVSEMDCLHQEKAAKAWFDSTEQKSLTQ